jgi:sugar/nucleoside kinase (ribokinase family)
VFWFRRGKRVLTIGSVHLDTIALSNSPTTLDVTHVGSITHSVGGSAYNIAANLASHHGRAISKTAIYSILPQHSVLTEIIKYKIDAARISSKYIRLYKDFIGRHVRGGGYVGVLDNTRLMRHAVVDAAMYDANIFRDTTESTYLESAVAWADYIMLDADLAVSTVNRIADHARDHGKPLFVSIGSPTAGIRSWTHSHSENLATCVSGRLLVLCQILEALEVPAAEIEAFRQFVESGATAEPFDINAICQRLMTRHVVCCNVQKSQGFALLAAGKRPYKCFVTTPEEVRDRIQAGKSAGIVDAAHAGFINSYAKLDTAGKIVEGEAVNDTTQRVFNTTILDLVEHVSESEGATPGSVISFEEEAGQQSQLAKIWRLTKIAFDVLPVFKYLLSVAAAIIALWLVDLTIDVLAYFGHEVTIPDKSWLRMLLRR